MNKKSLFFLFIIFLLSCEDQDSVPIYDYYKNIPVIRGWTKDEVSKNYMIEVVLVYRENNTDLKTMVNQLKPQLIDTLRAYFSSLKEVDFKYENQENIKKEAVRLLNENILASMKPKDADKIRKIKDLSKRDLLLDIDIMQLQIFSLN